MAKIKEIPPLLRPREKAKLYGFKSLSDEELLAIVLSSGTKNKSVLDLSRELIYEFNGLLNVFEAPFDEIIKYHGINEVKALTIKAVEELRRRMIDLSHQTRIIFDDANKVISFFAPRFLGERQENLYLASLTRTNKLIAFHLVYKGTETSVFGDYRDIFRLAIKDGAKKVYLLHNHPSDNVAPSNEDIKTTNQLMIVALTLGIALIDHLIVGLTKAYSLKEKKLINIDCSTE